MTSNCLTLSTVLDLTVKNSEKGVNYYRKMHQLAQEPTVKHIFHRLAEEEDEERRSLIKVGQAEAEKGQIDLDEQTYCYLCALGDELNFPYDEIKEFKALSPRDALEIGIEAKKDGILLYHELLKRCASQEAHNIIMHLIESEQRHLLELRDFMYELCPTGCK